MPPLHPFQLERYFAKYEFSAPYLLSPSDCEILHLDELLGMADPECSRLWQGLSLGYTESQGHPLLRAEIARLYEGLDLEDVLVLAPEEGIFIAMNTLISPGDEVLAIHPAYQSLHEVAASIGCLVVRWPVTSSGGGWRIDVTAMEGLITPRTRLLVLNFPHNPTGYLPAPAELDHILEIARRYELVVFSDEMYRLMEYDPGDRLPPLCTMYENAVSLSGVSKGLALPGLRIGWLATRNQDWIKHWISFKDYTTICSSAPSEILALVGLRARETILARNMGIIHANLKYAASFFGRHSERFEWLSPRAGSVAFPRLKDAETSEAFCRTALEQQRVVIAPGSLFDSPGPHFRLGLGRLSFPEALDRIKDIII